ISHIAALIRFHHVFWDNGKGRTFQGLEVPLGSHILNLADRVAVLIDKNREILGQVNTITEKLKLQSGKMFNPELVNAFTDLAAKEYFWFEAAAPQRESIMFRGVQKSFILLDMEMLLSFTQLFSRIIDFRSRHTATHSSGVAVVAETLAGLTGFSSRECRLIRIAGYLHDLGKLSVPTEILDKAGPLTADEFNIVKRHPFYTFQLIEQIGNLGDIKGWAAYHHEKMNGTGYPYHLTDQNLSLGSRITMVADIFTALTEDRPYRKGLPTDMVFSILTDKASNNELDANLVGLLKNNFSKIDTLRLKTQQDAWKEYQSIGIEEV
ncbi:MAG: HD domain-containing phosphohydrolase, partial [Spirochaetota bacterium]